jgi:hypothetical protein
MLYITERGSLEDSLTYKNITLKIRYKDDSLSKHRKAIAEALMTAGAVTKPKASKVSVTIKRDEYTEGSDPFYQCCILSKGDQSSTDRGL